VRCTKGRYGFAHGIRVEDLRALRILSFFADNHMINGTKLLNVAGMTRGRRDGILKSEKMRHVVKIGPMHLKGVWYGAKAPVRFKNCSDQLIVTQDPL
jgi:hypothetical protein